VALRAEEGSALSVVVADYSEEIDAEIAYVDIELSGSSEVEDGIEITDEGLDHVLERHTGDVAGKSTFSDENEVASLIRQAESVPPVPQAFGSNFQRVVDAGKIIGVDRLTGLPTSIYTVITAAAGKLITAFPGLP
jgi:hypothetical protein